jgi:hypothetical protein
MADCARGVRKRERERGGKSESSSLCLSVCPPSRTEIRLANGRRAAAHLLSERQEALKNESQCFSFLFDPFFLPPRARLIKTLDFCVLHAFTDSNGFSGPGPGYEKKRRPLSRAPSPPGNPRLIAGALWPGGREGGRVQLVRE